MAQSAKLKPVRAGTPRPAEAPHAQKPDRYFSRAIGNALTVLETLRQAGSPLTLSEVTAKTRLPKSSAFRILRTLEVAGYAERGDGDRFRLAEKAAALHRAEASSTIAEAAAMPMRQLAREFRETVSLAVLLNNHIEVAAVVDSPQRVHMGNVVGGIIPPHASSLGKCIAAFQKDEDRERLIRCYGMAKMTDKTISEELDLHRELELVRARGYATDLEESALDGCCLAAPIMSRDARVVAAVSVSMPKARFTHPDRIVAAVRDAAAEIAKNLARAAAAANV